MARGLTAAEKFFRRVEALALSTLPLRGLTAAAPEHHDGVMVALVPEDPSALAVDGEGALPADDLHVTLCYLGKVQDLSNADKSKILADSRRVCDAVGHTFSTVADGVLVMGSNDDGVPATALLVQSDDIVDLYDALSEALNYQSSYPSFIPHMTTGYGVPVDAAQAKVGQRVDFTKVIVKFGEDTHVIPLTAAITAANRTANVIDRVIDSLGRLWDEALHPRDSEGRFIKKNGAVSGNLAVPTRDRKSVTMVDANRASVVGFHTFGEDVWVLAEITNPDGSKIQGFARATNVRSVAPVKARLDALYPIDDHGDAFINSSLERKRQLDLILAHITSEFGPDNDEDGAFAFLETLGLWEKDLDYIMADDTDEDFLGGIRRVDRPLDDDESDEQESIIEDARSVKELRDRVHGLSEDSVDVDEQHVVPKQQLLQDVAPEQETIDALNAGADPLTLKTANLLGALAASSRHQKIQITKVTGVSPIGWFVDQDDDTGTEAWLAGAGWSTTERAYFVKESVIGAALGNTDVVNEVAASLIAENVAATVGDDEGLLRTPRSVFGDNPEWDGQTPLGSEDPFSSKASHRPAHVVSEHAAYLVPSDWTKTDATTEETGLRNDVRGVSQAAQDDMRQAFYEDMGDIYGNSVAKMILWDFLILNGDRNPGNAILAAPPDGRSEGVAVPIDHGFAFDEPFAEGGSAAMFEWYMKYPLARAWLNYVRGGLALDNNVTRASVTKAVQDFVAAYGKMDAEQIIETFRAIPGVTDQQMADVTGNVRGVLDRVLWMGDNMDTVLEAMIERPL